LRQRFVATPTVFIDCQAWPAKADQRLLRNHKIIKYRIGIARDTGWGACYNDAG
jgi:hypothetical protein